MDNALLIDRSALPDRELSFCLLLLQHLTPRQGWTPEQYRQMLTVAGTHTLYTDTHQVRIQPNQFTFSERKFIPPPFVATIPTLPYQTRLGDYTLRLDIVPRPDSFSQDGTLFLTPQLLPLQLRPRQPGDRMAVHGLGGKRKPLKKLYQELGIVAQARDWHPLLCTGDGQILAIVGHRIAHPAAVRDKDTRVLRISWTHQRPDLA